MFRNILVNTLALGFIARDMALEAKANAPAQAAALKAAAQAALADAQYKAACRQEARAHYAK